MTPAHDSYPSSTLLPVGFPHARKPLSLEDYLQPCSSLPAFPGSSWPEKTLSPLFHHTVASFLLFPSMLLQPGSSFQNCSEEHQTLVSLFFKAPVSLGCMSNFKEFSYLLLLCSDGNTRKGLQVSIV